MPQKPLVIGIDVRSLQKAKTGTRTYLEEICKEFKLLNRDDVVVHFLDSTIPVINHRHRFFVLVEHLRFQLWKQLILPLKAFSKGCDILFCTDEYVPLLHLGYQTVPVLHDAFCFEMPQNYGRFWLWTYMQTAIRAARKSPLIVTPTHYAKGQIAKFSGISPSKLTVVYEGPKTKNAFASNAPTEQALKKFGLTPGNYLLHVGAMFKRKNLLTLLHAFAEIRPNGFPDLKLVLAGPVMADNIDSDYEAITNFINQHNLQQAVVLTDYIDSASIDQLYANANIYVFPSINEGFGIPVLEAFSHALPVIVANNTCLPEVGGDAVLQFNPHDSTELATKIKLLLTDTTLRENLIEKGTERLKFFTWKNTVAQLVDAFRLIAKK